MTTEAGRMRSEWDNKRLGNDHFSILISDLRPDRTHVAHSQLRLAIAGEGWALGGEVEETFGVVVPRLVAFGRSRARHWAPFPDMDSPAEVLDSIRLHGFGSPEMANKARRWDISSAFGSYSLSALFDANLGVNFAVAIRGSHHETIIAERYDGTLLAENIGIRAFDQAIEALASWMGAVQQAA